MKESPTVRVCPVCGRPGAAAEVRCPHDGASLVVLEGSLEARETDLLGQVVDGRYRVESVIGRGGMGIVFAARHVVVGRRVALKVLKPSMEHSEETLQRFVREAQAANAVRSPYILRADDFGQLGSGAFYVVMDLLEGSALGDALRERRLSHDTLLDVFGQLAEGLGAAHAAGIVHRDLKPDNVFLIESPTGPQVRILDFGVAKLMHQGSQGLTETGVILGTPHYMSPEQARGLQIDHRSDIYAFGVVLYQAFTGRLPFISDSAVGVLTAHAVEEPPRPSLSGVDGALEAIILRCMQKRPEARFQTMFDVVAALRERRGRGAAGMPAMIAETQRAAGLPSASFASPLSAASPAQWVAPPQHYAPMATALIGSGAMPPVPSPSPPTDTHAAMSGIAPQPVSRGLYLALGAGIAIVGVVGALLLLGTGRSRGQVSDTPSRDSQAPASSGAMLEPAPSASSAPPSVSPPAPAAASSPAGSSPAASSPAASVAMPSASTQGNPPPAGPPRATGGGQRPSSSPPPPATPTTPPTKPPPRPEIRSPFD